MEGPSKYPECDHIRRKFVDVQVNEELALELSQDTIFPLFEKRVRDYKRMKNSSLERNELLRCRWKSLVRNIEGRKFQPYEFPHLSDFHFLNCSVRFKPSETITNRVTQRFQMACGPGVDAYGEIPIPSDMCLRK